jgi:hypothetical protein
MTFHQKVMLIYPQRSEANQLSTVAKPWIYQKNVRGCMVEGMPTIPPATALVIDKTRASH